MKILVIGHPEAVLGYSLVGVEGKAVTSAEETSLALDTALSDHSVGIILVTGDVAEMVRPKMDELQLHSTVPLVVEIPAPERVQPPQPSLNEIVFRAIGVKI
ncbi:MAG: V-type ATP synthase subunit F [Anaerolineaceae bacterium]|jgi:vacuolar-type H+-ATPase subunit F/Vma7